jgi:hypothetical protein
MTTLNSTNQTSSVLIGTQVQESQLGANASTSYGFQLSSRSSFSALLTSLSGNANFELNNAQSNQTLQFSSNVGSLADTLNLVLDPGSYTVTVSSADNSAASFKLSLTAQPSYSKSLIWRNEESGDTASWLVPGTSFQSGTLVGNAPRLDKSSNWKLAAVVDLNGDQESDFIWRNVATDQTAFWFIKDGNLDSSVYLGNSPSIGQNSTWQIVGAADFNSDNSPDLLWYNSATGETGIWYLNGTDFASGASIQNAGRVDPNSGWQPIGVGQFSGSSSSVNTLSGTIEILWRNQSSDQTAAWSISNGSFAGATYLDLPSLGSNSEWKLRGTKDFNSDGKTDLLWQNDRTGQVALWFLDGYQFSDGTFLGNDPIVGDSNWDIVAIGDRYKEPTPISIAGTARDSALDLGTLSAQASVNDALGSNMSGYYKVTLPRDGAFSATVKPLSGSAPVVEVFDNAGNAISSSQLESLSAGAYYVKLEAKGDSRFTLNIVKQFGIQQFGTPGYDYTSGVTTDSSGNVYVAGYTFGAFDGTTNAGGSDAFIAKYDSSGNQMGIKQFGTASDAIVSGVATDSSGNIYVAGSTTDAFDGSTNAGSSDAFIVKYDSSGNQTWVMQLATTSYDTISGVTTDSSGNVYVAGSTAGALYGTTNAGGRDAFIVKYDSSGNQTWVMQLATTSYDAASGVTTDSSGNVYVAGSTTGAFDGSTNAGGSDAFIAKYDSSGNQMGIKQFGTTTYDAASGVTTDSSGNVYVAGSTTGAFDGSTNAGGSDAFIAKYDSSGNQTWVMQFGTASDEIVSGVATDSSGNVYVTGSTAGALYGTTNAGRRDAFIAKYDSSGNQMGIKQFGTTGGDSASGVTIDSSGNVYVTGYTTGALYGTTNAGGSDAFIYKVEDVNAG